MRVYVTPRDWWGAEPPGSFIPPMKFPIKYVFFTYTKGSYGFSERFCQKELRKLQEKHMKQGASDIIYNFVVAGSGIIYECRGWNYRPKLAGKFSEIYSESVFIAHMGIFKGTEPTEKMMRAGDWLIKLGIRRGLIHEKFVEYRITATGYEGYTPQKIMKKKW